MKKILAICLPLMLGLGCATATFNPYHGEQMTWPVNRGAVANMEFGIPIYKSAPPQPYEVLGEVTTEHIGSVTEFSSIGAIAKKAKAIGADALLMVEPGSFFTASSVAGSAAPTRAGSWASFMREVGRNTVLLAIKWKEQPVTEAAPEATPEKAPEKAPETAPAPKQ